MPSKWHNAVLLATVFWFSSSLLVDFLIMPGMFISGMMTQPEFATTGYTLFWLFNRVELVCGAVILTGLLILRYQRSSYSVVISGIRSRWSLTLGVSLLTIALTYTYLLTPAMGGLGISLDVFKDPQIATDMSFLHGSYWTLELLKLAASAMLIRLSYSDFQLSYESLGTDRRF